LSYFRKILYIFILITFFASSAPASSKLIFALDVIRHGDRTPIYELPSSMYTWPDGLGQLTAIGMRQEYELGLKLRKRYIEDHALLPYNYLPNTIHIQSTDYDRTIMSASSLLMGLYPLGTGPNLSDSTPALPSNFQPIPIHTTSTDKDNIFLINMDSREVAELLERFVYTRADWKNKSLQLSSYYSRWSHLTGLNIESLWDIVKIGDTFTAYLVHDIALPDGLSKEETLTLIEEGRWILATYFKPSQVGDVVGNKALKKIIEYIRLAIEGKSKIKFVLVSSHDSTLLALMSALHTPLNTSPPYASILNFSLYQDDLKNYFITVSYNDNLITIPGCYDKMCTVDQFLKLGS
jgi:acid phosphatase